MIDTIPSATVREPAGVCPSCNTTTTFTFIGLQHWPEAVAKASQMKPVQQIFRCKNCHTSLSEATLDDHISASE